MSDIWLINGDCLAVLPTLETASVDMVCADPPYGTTACKWDSIIPLAPMWRELNRIIKPRGAIVLTASQPFTTTLISSNREWFKYCWVWWKNSPVGQNAKYQPVRIHEDITVFSFGQCGNGCAEPMTYNPQGIVRIDRLRNEPDGGPSRNHRPGRQFVRRNYIQKFSGYPQSVLAIDCDGAQHQRIHPTQKPVALMEYLIRTYTNEGETVLDFCMGSGTTMVACLQTGRRGIGIEVSEGYYRIAEKRIAEAQSAYPLFAECKPCP